MLTSSVSGPSRATGNAIADGFLAREPVHFRAARIGQPQQLPDLVERLARRVVARGAEPPGSAAFGDVVDLGVPSGRDHPDVREGDLVLERGESRCASTWFTAANGIPRATARPFAYSSPTRSDPTSPGPAGAATVSTPPMPTPVFASNSSTTFGSRGDVRARGQLGHDAAILGVHVLRPDHVAEKPAVLDQPGAGVVAGGFDA